MRKLIFATLIFGLVFAGCDAANYSVSITNNSSKVVSFSYNGAPDSLAASQTKTYEVKAYTPPPQNIVDPNGIASISMNRDGDSFTFSAATGYTLNVVNKLPIIVKIKADNYIDDNNSTELTIGADTEKTTAKIYTLKPNFTSLIDSPIIIDWNVSDDTVFVIIR